MKFSDPGCRGRADPFGLLVLVLLLALSVTVVIQAQASSRDGASVMALQAQCVVPADCAMPR